MQVVVHWWNWKLSHSTGSRHQRNNCEKFTQQVNSSCIASVRHHASVNWETHRQRSPGRTADMPESVPKHCSGLCGCASELLFKTISCLVWMHSLSTANITVRSYLLKLNCSCQIHSIRATIQFSVWPIFLTEWYLNMIEFSLNS